MTIFYTAPTAIRACMKWGAEHPEPPRPVQAAAARDGRRADQPEGVALVLQGHRRRALPDRRHVVADRDRRDHDHAAAGRTARQARLGDARRCRASCAAVVDEDGDEVERGTQGLLSLRGRGRRCCARCTATTSATSRRTSRSSGRETYFVGDAARAGRRRLLLGHRPRRRRPQRLGPPHVDRRGRVGDRVAPEGRRGAP